MSVSKQPDSAGQAHKLRGERLPEPLQPGAEWRLHSNGRSGWWYHPGGVDPSQAAVISVRLSKDREGAKLGPRTQINDGRELAAAKGLTVVGEFVDDDIPISESNGRTPKERPAFKEMLTVLASERVGTLIAWHTDRLYRGFGELDKLMKVCKPLELPVLTVKSGELDLATATGRLIAGILAVVGMAEVERAIERIKAQKRQAALDGQYQGGRRSFGFEPDGVTHREAEARALRDDSKRALADVALGQISREWNAQGLRTTGGKEFRALEVRRILLRPRNAGYSVYHGEIVNDAVWDPIVDRDTWTALRAKLETPGRGGNSFERKYQGSGVYRCGKCSSVTYLSGAKRVDGTPIYKCRDTGHLSRAVEPVDDMVTKVIVKRLSLPDAAITFGTHNGVDLSELHTRRAATQARLDELAELFAARHIDASQLKAGSIPLRAELESIEQQQVAAREESVLANLPLGTDGVWEAWKACSPDVRGKMIDALLTVTILPGRGKYFDPSKVQIEWKDAAAAA
ncbi:recombinase family protein [Nocardia sp. NPDC050710]|uniref:recombinase family protein n=1 Tax=Nocardia sp. NPDC050710 TaxID=3157220 RepID=UPI0033C2FCB7